MASERTTYEYIRTSLDFGDLSEINSLGSAGWRVISVTTDGSGEMETHWALLEREIPMRDMIRQVGGGTQR